MKDVIATGSDYIFTHPVLIEVCIAMCYSVLRLKFTAVHRYGRRFLIMYATWHPLMVLYVSLSSSRFRLFTHTQIFCGGLLPTPVGDSLTSEGVMILNAYGRYVWILFISYIYNLHHTSSECSIVSTVFPSTCQFAHECISASHSFYRVCRSRLGIFCFLGPCQASLRR